jgi:hypothetical protein
VPPDDAVRAVHPRRIARVDAGRIVLLPGSGCGKAADRR